MPLFTFLKTRSASHGTGSSRLAIRRALGLAGLVLALGAASCSSSDEGSTPGDSASGQRSAEASFPRTVTSALGAARLDAAPRRVVALGQPDQDIAAALGVRPVGIIRGFGTESGIYPWQESALGGPDVTVLDTQAGTPFEKVAALRPDLVSAVSSFTIEDDYAKLSRLAPTLGYVEGQSRDSYQQQTRLVARALGREQAAEKVLAALDRKIATVRREHPEFAGKTMTYAFVSAANDIRVVNDEGDPTIKLLAQLGVGLPPKLKALPKDPGATQTMIGLERLDLLQADVLVMAYLNPQLKRKIEGNRVFASLPVVKAGGYSEFDLATISGLREPTVLSIPYGLEKLTAALVRATD